MIRLTLMQGPVEEVLSAEIVSGSELPSAGTERLSGGRVDMPAVEVAVCRPTLLGASRWDELPAGPIRARVHQLMADGAQMPLADGMVHVVAKDGAPGIRHDEDRQVWTLSVVQDAREELSRRLRSVRSLDGIVGALSITTRVLRSDDEDVTVGRVWFDLVGAYESVLKEVDCTLIAAAGLGIPLAVSTSAGTWVRIRRPWAADAEENLLRRWSGEELVRRVDELMHWTLDVQYAPHPSTSLIARVVSPIGAPGLDADLSPSLPAIDGLEVHPADVGQGRLVTGRAPEAGDWGLTLDQDLQRAIELDAVWTPMGPAGYAAEAVRLRRSRRASATLDSYSADSADLVRLPWRLCAVDEQANRSTGDGAFVETARVGRPVFDMRDGTGGRLFLADMDGTGGPTLPVAYREIEDLVEGPGAPPARYVHALWATNLARMYRIQRSALAEVSTTILLEEMLDYPDDAAWPRAGHPDRGVALGGLAYLLASLVRDAESHRAQLDLIRPHPELAPADIPPWPSGAALGWIRPDGDDYEIQMRVAFGPDLSVLAPHLVHVAYVVEGDSSDPIEEWPHQHLWPFGVRIVVRPGEEALVFRFKPVFVDGRDADWQEFDTDWLPPEEELPLIEL